jgi:hypothetical protein
MTRREGSGKNQYELLDYVFNSDKWNQNDHFDFTMSILIFLNGKSAPKTSFLRSVRGKYASV